MALITWADKSAMGTQPTIPEVNKITDNNMNEIKTAINNSTSYSTTEQVIGTWYNNKPIYRKIVMCGALPNNDQKNVSHGISDLDWVVNAYGIAKRISSSSYTYLPVNNSRPEVLSAGVGMWIDETYIALRTAIDRSDFTTTCVVIEYTKTTD